MLLLSNGADRDRLVPSIVCRKGLFGTDRDPRNHRRERLPAGGCSRLRLQVFTPGDEISFSPLEMQ